MMMMMMMMMMIMMGFTWHSLRISESIRRAWYLKQLGYTHVSSENFLGSCASLPGKKPKVAKVTFCSVLFVPQPRRVIWSLPCTTLLAPCLLMMAEANTQQDVVAVDNVATNVVVDEEEADVMEEEEDGEVVAVEVVVGRVVGREIEHMTEVQPTCTTPPQACWRA